MNHPLIPKPQPNFHFSPPKKKMIGPPFDYHRQKRPAAFWEAAEKLAVSNGLTK